MDKEQVAQETIKQCNDENSFIVKLHSHFDFDEEQYQKLIAAISSYVSLIQDEETINRQVAGCVFDLCQQIELALTTFDRRQHPDLKKVQDAHAQTWELAQDLFNLPNPT